LRGPLFKWVERSDTHQSQFAKLMGFAKGSTHPTRFFDDLGSVKVPVKVIAGELDLSCTPELMKRDIVEQLPTAALRIIPNAAHMVSLEKTSELVRLLLAETP
jgi:pimeloyl-ACP methyl ester carboxylesterase